MFSRMQLMAGSKEIAERFNARLVIDDKTFFPTVEISGFEHAYHPVLIKENNQLIYDNFQWGLVPPDWKKEPSAIWNHTISAKLEYISKRYAWQKVAQNRCLIPATAYFEYHWNDDKGNSKTKYKIIHRIETLFALAGLYSIWRDKNGNVLKTFAVCTTKANEVMEFVHNKDTAKNYHRMPVMLNPNNELNWLDDNLPYMDFAFPNYKPDLIAIPVTNDNKGQTQLLL